MRCCPGSAILRQGDRLLIGADLVKPERDLLFAYDDPLGVTAAFNRNLLVRVNRELEADFELDQFAHRAVWNEPASRMEMHLIAGSRQHVEVRRADLAFDLEAGEPIWTESSYKFHPETMVQFAAVGRIPQRGSMNEPRRALRPDAGRRFLNPTRTHSFSHSSRRLSMAQTFVPLGTMKRKLRGDRRSEHPSSNRGAPPRQARAVVAIVPGFNLAPAATTPGWPNDFVDCGLAVYAVDLRGRGQSDGERFYVEKFSDYVADAAANLVKLAKSREPGLPVFLLGHSAGGVISCLYAIDHQAELAGFILKASRSRRRRRKLRCGLERPPPRRAHTHVLHLENEDFSRDPAVVRNNERGSADGARDPADAHGGGDGPRHERLEKEFSRITLPVFILHGTLDKAAKPAAASSFSITWAQPTRRSNSTRATTTIR